VKVPVTRAIGASAGASRLALVLMTLLAAAADVSAEDAAAPAQPSALAKPAVSAPAAPAARAPFAPGKPSAAGAQPPSAPKVVAAPSSPEAEAAWKAYEKRWAETEDYAAGFRQTIEVPDIGSTVESAGRFFFAKPGLVRWEYNEGPPQTVIGDGEWIWLHQPDLDQVYKIPYAKAFGRGGLVELLAGREGVAERYRASLEKPDATSILIRLQALVEGEGDLEVTLEADTFDLKAVTVHDPAGSTTNMIFSEPLRNRGVDRGRFAFTPPPGVDIVTDFDSGF
jgi:outer membrane lipoprotein carrier protein